MLKTIGMHGRSEHTLECQAVLDFCRRFLLGIAQLDQQLLRQLALGLPSQRAKLGLLDVFPRILQHQALGRDRKDQRGRIIGVNRDAALPGAVKLQFGGRLQEIL